jgi:hypothetical protein
MKCARNFFSTDSIGVSAKRLFSRDPREGNQIRHQKIARIMIAPALQVRRARHMIGDIKDYDGYGRLAVTLSCRVLVSWSLVDPAQMDGEQ